MIQPADGAAKPARGQVQRGNTLPISPSDHPPFFSWPWLRFKVSANKMEPAMRMTGAACLVAICGALACVPASATSVPPFKGNDTGGIIAYPLATQTDVRQLAVDHCGTYGKVAKFLAVDRQYGGYISFACRWVPYGAAERPLRTKY
jgi:hypothetical protein